MELEVEPRKKFTTDEVMRMVEAGILGEDDRLELIEGELLVVSPQDPIHAGTVQRLNRKLMRAYGEGYQIRPQLPILASRMSMPEPDLAVVRGDERSFDRRHPGGADIVLVVEVTWTTAKRDRRKAEIYARAGMPVYWRLDLEHRRLEVYEVPAPDGVYMRVRLLSESDEVEVPETELRWLVADLLPSP
jgi:Uma2 family endonuclease